jgi:DNA mismatch repair ATPase MutS
VTYFKEYHEIEPYLVSFRYIRRLLHCAGQIDSLQIEELAGEQARLKKDCHQMKDFLRHSYLVLNAQKGNSNPLEILLDYFRMIFSLDLIQFNKALQAVRGHRKHIDEMITLLGQLECAVVVGSYRKSLKEGWCIPMVHYEGTQQAFLHGEELYHPLLTNPVKNSIRAEEGILLTGANASGKSTFLRAVSLSVILAQTIHTCPAKSYEATAFWVYSSMSLNDSILSGDSYYMTEIKSIQRILEQTKAAGQENAHVLCFVDEVLRGTNTVERIAASTQILKMLAAGGAVCFAATHDVELTALLAEQYHNYHFEEKIEGEDICFPYRLSEGPATSRNAIALLKALGYDDKIVQDAETMAEHFLQTGTWS